MERILCLVIGYAFGLIQASYIAGRMRGVDIRKMGSGNAGSTNTLRTFGLKYGLAVLGVDIGKCLLAVLVTWLLFRNRAPEIVPLLKIYTSAGVICGHVFPFYLGFRGGKGIASFAGMIIAFLDWRLILIAAVLFIGIFVFTHYVSLGSLALVSSFLVGVTVCSLRGNYGMTGAQRVEMILVTAVITALAFIAHRENIQRLLSGTERKTYLTRRN